MYKIFVDAHVFDGEFQGTRTYINELYSRVLKSNPDVLVYFAAYNIDNLKSVFGIFDNARFLAYKTKKRWKRIFVETPALIEENGCTHAHFQYIIPFKKNKNCKFIVTIHDILFNDFRDEFSSVYRIQRNILFYLSAKRADFLVTVSNYSKHRIAQQYHVDEEKIILIPNAVSEDFLSFNHSKNDSKNHIAHKYNIENFILYVSRIEPRKNQTLLLELFLKESLYSKGLALVLIGSNSLKTDLFEKINLLSDDIRKNIFWIEQVEYEDLKHFLNAAEIFVYPSKAEGFGIPPLEAGVMKVPVLCSNATAMKDFYFFEPYMFDPDDYNDFRSKFTQLMEKKKEIDFSLIQKSIMNIYSWDKFANIIMDIVRNNK
jgi:glycosyltransferase involved in cell wall biosynthesis